MSLAPPAWKRALASTAIVGLAACLVVTAVREQSHGFRQGRWSERLADLRAPASVHYARVLPHVWPWVEAIRAETPPEATIGLRTRDGIQDPQTLLKLRFLCYPRVILPFDRLIRLVNEEPERLNDTIYGLDLAPEKRDGIPHAAFLRERRVADTWRLLQWSHE